MTVYLHKHVAIDNEKIAFSVHRVRGKVVLLATMDQSQFDELSAFGADIEDMEDDGHGEPEKHD
jgi:hypothetical protein